MSVPRSRVFGAVVASSLAVCGVTLLPQSASAQISIFGTSADLVLRLGPLARGGKTPVSIDVLARRAVTANNVYVELRCTEYIDIEDYNVPGEQSSEKGKQKAPDRKIKVHKQEVTESKTYSIADNQQYLANTTHQLKAEIEIPAAFPFTAKGKMFRVKCEARSGLAVFGNDPNSSWQEVEIK